MPLFQDHEHSQGHFDPHASPRYLMVREGNTARVVVANDKLVAKSQNEHVASLENKYSRGNGRVWGIVGNKPPQTYIELFDAKGRRCPDRLEVDVKPKKRLTVAFHFVIEDGHRGKTTRDTNNMAGWLLNELDEIYRKQTNIVFNEDPTTGGMVTRSKDIQIGTTLYDIVFEQERGPRDPRKPTQEWDTLAAQSDPDADINVFFMPLSPGKNMRGFNSKVLVKDRDWICVFPDGMSDDRVRTALPHWIGVFLGCYTTSNEKNKHHLMFWTRADGMVGNVPGPGGMVPVPGTRYFTRIYPFIPRDCVRVMNP